MAGRARIGIAGNCLPIKRFLGQYRREKMRMRRNYSKRWSGGGMRVG
jgi:hypothetical protein